MAKLNTRRIDVNLSRIKGINQACFDLAGKKLMNEKQQLLNDFNAHPVTKEIEGGVSSPNISGTLGGMGNLFSFIGFDSGSDPVSIIRTLINKIRLVKKIKSKKITRKGVSFGVEFFAPKLSEFERSTPMPWATGRSWLLGIERGISGFGYYISRKLSGRSGGGIQSNNQIRSGSFRNTSYFSKIYSNFFKKVNQ